ncbi:hypothetical protein LshimejAT787_0701900 [Lyophyllum shimeji]|uniref:G domain-containing protein n=1 Tax=Lyophyllum shimeji TaxID=47721 RepID=A0A9P3PPI7_LYOSH|nr:hypothetical protein LshimejAT787_0701900 [Lyophyllum shimeji]
MVLEVADEHLQFTEHDVVILVIGLTGAGKSTFVNEILGAERMQIGRGSKPCTKQVDCAIINPETIQYLHSSSSLRGRRIVIVDTPGFDNDDDLSDRDISLQIATWLETSYASKKKSNISAGIIYLHDISQSRYFAESKRTLAFVRALSGNSAHRVVLGMTKWGRTSSEEEKRNESELVNEHWQAMTTQGSQVCKFDGSRESALKVMDILLHQEVDGGDAIWAGIARIRKVYETNEAISRIDRWDRFLSWLRNLGRRLFA